MVRSHPVPGQTQNEGTELFLAQFDTCLLPPLRWNKSSPVQSPGSQPQAKPIMHQYLQAIGAFVHEYVGMVWRGLAKHLDYTGKTRVRACSHIQGFFAQPYLINADHDCKILSQGAACWMWLIGQCIVQSPITNVTLTSGAAVTGIAKGRKPKSLSVD